MAQRKFNLQIDRLFKEKAGRHIPTLNKKGFQMATHSPLIHDWIKSFDGQNPLLDLGCAFGINTYKALDVGIPVIALDMDRRHLHVVEKNVSRSESHLLSCVFGSLPSDIPLQDSSVSGILLSEVMHFLADSEMQPAMKTLFDKLVPGGRLFVTTVSIHYFDDIDETMVDEFYSELKKGVKWPGYIEFNDDILTKIQNAAQKSGERYELGTGRPSFVHLCVPEQLKKAFSDVGFEIERAQHGRHPGYQANSSINPRVGVHIIARKPLDCQHETFITHL